MKKFLNRAWPHILIIAILVLFVVFAPAIYNRLFPSQEGNPTPPLLPPSTSQAKFAIERLSVTEENRYNLEGWAFLTVDKSVPADEYERQIVLVSDQSNIFFTAVAMERLDVQIEFGSLGIDVTRSGFMAALSLDSVQEGMYKVGIYFRDPESGIVYYVQTDKCIERTPNYLELKNEEYPACSTSIASELGQSILTDVQLPMETTLAKSFIEGLVKSDTKTGLYDLQGWGFLLLEEDLSPDSYQRQVVLYTDTGNYVFPVAQIERLDVQEHFASLDMDVTNSGFVARIPAGDISLGNYGIGIIYHNLATDRTYFVSAGRCITRTTDELILEESGSSACNYLLGNPVNLPTDSWMEISDAKSWVDSLNTYDNQGLYLLQGWAFPAIDSSTPTSSYERWTVLYSENEKLNFTTTGSERLDVQSQFGDLGMDVRMSGFSTFVNKNALHSEVYGVGFIFRNIYSGEGYYFKADRCISNSSEGLILEDRGAAACDILKTWGSGDPVGVNIELPVGAVHAQYFVEQLIPTEADGIYELKGWSFLNTDTASDAGNYDRQIILLTGSRNYAFSASIHSRADVEAHFSDNPANLTMSGFLAQIDSSAIEPGIYRIGLLFRSIETGEQAYVETNSCLTRTTDGLVLEEPGSSACPLP